MSKTFLRIFFEKVAFLAIEEIPGAVLGFTGLLYEFFSTKLFFLMSSFILL
mgnify:CR=1 FL=1